MKSSEPCSVLTFRPQDSASLLRSKCREARTAPPLLTLQPPLGSGTTWWEFLAMVEFYHCRRQPTGSGGHCRLEWRCSRGRLAVVASSPAVVVGAHEARHAAQIQEIAAALAGDPPAIHHA